MVTPALKIKAHISDLKVLARLYTIKFLLQPAPVSYGAVIVLLSCFLFRSWLCDLLVYTPFKGAVHEAKQTKNKMRKNCSFCFSSVVSQVMYNVVNVTRLPHFKIVVQVHLVNTYNPHNPFEK